MADRGIEPANAPSAGGEEAALARFVRDRDEAAFRALVTAHGPMVLGVCRRVLWNEQDAEDAFQAAFLVLAQDAAGLSQRGVPLGAWLHGVAYRIALRVRREAGRRKAREQQPPKLVPGSGKVVCNGQPLQLSTVRLHPVGREVGSSEAIEAISDQAGAFSLETFKRGPGAPVGRHKVTVRPVVRPPGFLDDVLEPDTTPLEVELKDGGADGLVLKVP